MAMLGPRVCRAGALVAPSSQCGAIAQANHHVISSAKRCSLRPCPGHRSSPVCAAAAAADGLSQADTADAPTRPSSSGSAGRARQSGRGRGGRGRGGRGSSGDEGSAAGGRGGSGRAGVGSGPRARGSTPTAVSAAAAAEADALFTDPGLGPLAAPRAGPVRVELLAGGRGRGLVTTRGVLPGELLLAVQPLALAAEREPAAVGTATVAVDEAVDGADAKFLELQRQLLGRSYTAREAAWLASLAGLAPPGDEDGTAEAAATAQDAAVALLPSTPELLESEEAEGARPQTLDGGAEASLPLPERLRDPDALADVVQANCLEPDGGAEDEGAFWARRAAAEAAGSAGEGAGGEGGGAASAGPRLGPVGLWPAASMMNHSCQPNAVAYLVGDTLLVRATRNVGRDSELTISYLPVGGGVYGVTGGGGGGGAAAATAAAATLLSPLKERQEALEDGWGFVCGCGRCRAEAALDPKLRTLITEITDTVGALREDFELALALPDTEAAGEAESDDEEEGEEADRRATGTKAGAGSGAAGGQAEAAAGEEEEDEEGEEGGGRLAVVAESASTTAAMLVELMDAAMTRLKLTSAEQMTAQSAVVPLYTLLWAALAAGGELEPRLAEVVAALVADVAPGSADHLAWAVAARETAEMIVAEEGALTDPSGGEVRRTGGGGFGGSSRRVDERVALADKACFKAFTARYGPISRGVYAGLMEARSRRADRGDQDEE